MRFPTCNFMFTERILTQETMKLLDQRSIDFSFWFHSSVSFTRNPLYSCAETRLMHLSATIVCPNSTKLWILFWFLSRDGRDNFTRSFCVNFSLHTKNGSICWHPLARSRSLFDKRSHRQQQHILRSKFGRGSLHFFPLSSHDFPFNGISLARIIYGVSIYARRRRRLLRLGLF